MAMPDPPMALPDPPMALLAELRHRCRLARPYCANPVQLERASAELDTETWGRVLDQAAALGVLQVHFSGGEPCARRDLVELVARAAERGLYSNLITSGVTLDEISLARLGDAFATDPACALSPDHQVMSAALAQAAASTPAYVYRRIGGAALA